ncbi:MAG: hypothetical protein ABWK53_06025 [Anaerolineales bacterium]
MKPVTWMYIGAIILFLMAACGLGLGGFLYLASLDPVQGQGAWATMGTALACIGLIVLGGGILLIVLAVRKTRQETAQNVTLKVDLPGETSFEAIKCKSCGGTLHANDIQIVNGAPMVHCPYCQTVYQLTEEPKW